MESKQNRALKEFDSLYKMIDDVYHEIALSMHLTDSAFLILYCLLELGDGCSQKDICKLYSISKQTVNSSVKSLEDKGVLIRKAGVGRDIHLFFTEFGREFSEKHIGPVFDMENATFESMEPRFLNVRVILAKSFARIHETNLKKQGKIGRAHV